MVTLAEQIAASAAPPKAEDLSISRRALSAAIREIGPKIAN